MVLQSSPLFASGLWGQVVGGPDAVAFVNAALGCGGERVEVDTEVRQDLARWLVPREESEEDMAG
jgi:hypothetical protein